MAFRLNLSNTYYVPVVVWTPAPEGGGFDKSTFEVEVSRPSTDDIVGFSKLNARDVLRKVVKGWKGLEDGDGNPVVFSETNLERLLKVPQAVHAMLDAFTDSFNKAREKN